MQTVYQLIGELSKLPPNLRVEPEVRVRTTNNCEIFEADHALQSERDDLEKERDDLEGKFEEADKQLKAIKEILK
jgi:hypothetical protein